jgi:uncharacterized protein YndB with AHSA1/START domain
VAFTPKIICTNYIVATPEKVWEALTEEKYIQQYFFGRRIESDWKAGSAFAYYMADGEIDIQGKIVECDKPRLFSFAWHPEWLDEYGKEAEALVRFRIDPLGDLVRLTLTESHQRDISDGLLEGGRKGWPVVMSGIKTLLETGKPMPLKDFPK